MISEEKFQEAQEIIEAYEKQKSHQIRGSILEDCQEESYEKGEPQGDCETDGHYLCETCKNCDLEAFNRLKW